MRLKKALKISGVVVAILLVAGFLAFLYVMPPLMIVPPEAFARAEAAAPPSLDHIADPAERRLAERGKYIVMTADCHACHFTPGPQGPRTDVYLAGGFKLLSREHGTVVSPNLTPHADAGLGRHSDDDIALALASGIRKGGRAMFYRMMPWVDSANWTEEDRRAVVAFLRAITPVAHRIPDPDPAGKPLGPEAVEAAYAGRDYGTSVTR